MVSLPGNIDGDTYKYIMSVIDFLVDFLRPLQTKETSEVAEHLLDIYMEHTPPEILQSDQGPEFKRVVKTVCEALNVRIVKSSAYSPQTQGKDERSHRTWKEKLRFDLINNGGDLNWVEYLQHYQQLYNESPPPFPIVLSGTSVHLKCTLVGINCFLGERKNMKFWKKITAVLKRVRAREKNYWS